MAHIRIVRDVEMAEAIRSSDAVFRDAEQISMGTAFPNVFSPSLSQSFGAFEDGKLVSFMGLVPSIVRIDRAHVPVYSVGSVYTLPEYRGQGHAGDILAAIKDHARRSGGALIFVSGDRSLYTRNGCHFFGAVARRSLTAAHAEPLLQRCAAERPDTVIREAEPADWFRLHRLAASRRVAFEHSVWDLADLIRNEAYASCLKLRHRVLVAARGDDIAAFAVVAVPDERQSKRTPFAVEWAGDAAAVAALFAYTIGAYRLTQLDVPVSWQEDELDAALANVPGEPARNLGTIHVADAERLFAGLEPYWETSNANAARDIRIQTALDGSFILSHADGQSATLDSATLVSLLFDPQPVAAAAAIRSKIGGLFPIPLPYAGGLNYV